ncbi:hypothetical protein JNB88_18550 [Rhizobium cauense]|uniref:hypothetical protein n=1 Tax=Rhizobium cauense TaxID=1166683 RepID=UPI001C6E8FBB|nr:hypothetical protein [Rhizobium cauense]MBW9115638.1 hypothetical protein [Rhizobium cauense]
MARGFHRHDAPLTSEDLSKCQLALEEFCRENDVEAASEEGERAAAIIIELYQQGIHDEQHLKQLVDAARGIIAS